MALTAAVITTACMEQPDDPGPLSPSGLGQSVASTANDAIDDDPVAVAIARAVPAFAGVYFNDEGRLVLALTDESRRSEIEALIRPQLSVHQTVAGFTTAEGTQFVVDVVPFSFLDLARYKTLLRPYVFAIPGVVSLDLKESENLVKVGVAEVGAESQVRDLASRLGIPEDAVTFWRVPYPQATSHTLDDPHPQGLIQGGWRAAQSPGATGCTLGFSARRASNAEPVFVINSHCTPVEHGYDGSAIYQPFDSIGYEILDPAPHTCGIASDPCRNADAALFAATSPIDLGKIARTTSSSGCDACYDSLTLNHSSPTLQITGKYGSIIENEILQKIGRRTGWTYGAVEDRCADYEVDGWVRQCSDRVDYSSDSGDSGSPVFSMKPDGTVVLRGIHWGRIAFVYNDALMSNISRVEMDLGSLTVFDPGPPSASIDGPSEVPPESMCYWTVFPNGGIRPYDYQWSGVLTGSSYTVSGTINGSGWLNVLVTDGLNRQSSTSLYVTVAGEPGGDECGG